MLVYLKRILWVVLYVIGIYYVYHTGLVKKYDNLFFFVFLCLVFDMGFLGLEEILACR